MKSSFFRVYLTYRGDVMQTMKRLLSAYENAYRLEFDNADKFVFFSDVHRGDNSLSDEFAHNQNIYSFALKHYYEHDYTYIEVGDGDELWEHSHFKHVIDGHSDVYLQLREFYKKGKMLMMYGNHNMELKSPHYVEMHLNRFFDEYADDYAELYPGIEVHEAIVMTHLDTGKEIFVVHGHQGDFINDHIWPITKAINRHFWHYLHVVGFTNPASPSKNRHKRHKIERNYTRWIKKYQKMLIVGHTHRPKFPSDGEEPYFNTGACVYPRHITCIELECGQISLIEWRVRTNDEGILQIEKRAVVGPEPVTKFLL